MMIWIIRGIKFGYKYNEKVIRTEIIKNAIKFVKLINERGKAGDKVIIVGGIFNSTNPSIIAINDAKTFLNAIKSDLYLVNTEFDLKKHDGKIYSVNDIFNFNVISSSTWVDNVYVIPYECDDENVSCKLYGYEINGVKIPEFYSDIESGIVVYDGKSCRVIENKGIKKTKIIKISGIDEINSFDFEAVKDYNIELEIKNDLFLFHRDECDMFVFKLNPIRVGYFSVDVDVKAVGCDVDMAIMALINDDKLIKQFNRIKFCLTEKK